MAWFRSRKKQSGGGSTLSLHEGKINTSGEVVADSDYYYTDAMPCPQGKVCFDFGDTYGSDAMIAFYKETDVFIDYWGSTQRYRVLDFTSDYQAGRKMRLSFPKTALSDTMYIDLAAFTMYSGSSSAEVVKIQ